MNPATFFAQNREREIQDPSEYIIADDNRSEAAKLNDAFPESPQTSGNFFGRTMQGVYRGIDNTVAGTGAIGMAIGSVLDNEWLKDFGEEVYINASRSATRNAPRVGSFTNIQNVGDFVEYATEAIAENAFNIPLVMAGGIGGGMAAARAIGQNAMAGLGGTVTRNAINGYVKKLVMDKGVQEAEKQVAKTIALGRVMGAYGAGYPLASGEMGSELYRETGTPEGTQGALLGGIPMAAVEIVPELGIIGRVFGKPAAKAIQDTIVQKYGVNTLKALGSGGGEEVIQDLMIDAAVYLEDPKTGRFASTDFVTNKIDAFLKGGVSTGAMQVGAQGLADLLAPSKNPNVNQFERQLENEIQANLEIPEPTAEDLAAAEGAIAGTQDDSGETASGEAPVEGEGAGSALSDQEKELAIVNDNLATSNAKLDELLLSETPDETQIKTEQENRKQLLEKKAFLTSSIDGYPKKYRAQPGARSPFAQPGLPAMSEQAGIDLLESSITDPADAPIKEALKPIAPTLAAMDVKLSLGAGRSSVSWDREGNISLKVGRDKFGKLPPDRLAKEIEHERTHVAVISGLRNQWRESGQTEDFSTFANKKLIGYGQTLRRDASLRTLQAFGKLYGNNPDLFTAKETPAEQEKADINLANEMIRAVIERMRTGEIDEDLKVAEQAAQKGNTGPIQMLLDMLRQVRDALVRYTDPKRAPKDIKEIVKKANEILDRYEVRGPRKARNTQTAPTTLPEQQNESTGNVAQPQAMPEAEPTEQPASAPAFISKAVEQQLADLGYPRAEINRITPAEAQEIIQENRTFIANDNAAQAGAELDSWEENFMASTVTPLFSKDYKDAKPERRKSKSKLRFALANPYYMTQPERVARDKAENYINAVGIVHAAKMAAAGALGDVDAETAAIITGVAHAALDGDGVNNLVSGIRNRKEREALAVEMTQVKRQLEIIGPAGGIAAGRAVRGYNSAILRTVKQFTENGSYAFRAAQSMVMDAFLKVNPNMDAQDFADIERGMREPLFKGIDRMVERKQFLAKLATLVRRYSNDPDALLKKMKQSIGNNVTYAREVARRGAARAGEEYFSADGEAHIRNIASKVANLIALGNSRNPKQKDIMGEALRKFAKESFGYTPVKNPRVKDKNLQILQAIIADQATKNEFVDMLEAEMEKQFVGGRSTEGWKAAKDILDAMREEGWSEGIRRAAIADLQNQLTLSVSKMLKEGWSDSKEKVMSLLKERMEGLADQDILDALYEDTSAALDEEAMEHIKNTFGFSRDENGKIIVSDKGRLKGGRGMSDLLSKLGTRIKDVTRMAAITQEAELDRFAKAYVKELGFPDDMARQVQQLVRDELATAVEITKETEIAKKIESLKNKVADPEKLNTKGLIDTLMEYANQGFLDNAAIYEAIRKNYKHKNLPPFSIKMGQMLRDMGNQMALLPDGLPKDEMRQLIADELANLGGITRSELATSYWYFSLLSGPSTQGVNITYNVFSTILTATALTVDRPKQAGLIWTSLLSAAKGTAAQKFLYTMQTGMAPSEITSRYHVGKQQGVKGIDQQARLPFERVSEQDVKNQTTWWDRAFYYVMFKLAKGSQRLNKVLPVEISARNLSRFMVATDVYFRTVARQAALAHQGVTGYDAAYESVLPQAIQDAGPGASQARIASIADSLAIEKLTQLGGSTEERNRAARRVARAEQIGLDAVAAGEQKGLIGKGARWLGRQAQDYPLLILPVVPFTNIVAGVWNQSLNYTPWGFVRYASAYFNDKSEWRVPNENGAMMADPLQAKQALIGTLAMAGISALFGGEDDDLEIYGPGPKNPADRKAFFAEGKKPFHFRVGDRLYSYQFLGQIAMGLGIVGTFQDIARDSRNDDQKEFTAQTLSELAANALMGGAKTMLNQSFLSSVSSLGEAMYSNSPGEGLLKWVSGLVGSSVPAIVRQTYNDVLVPQKFRSSEFIGQMAISLAVTKAWGTQPALSEFGDPLYKRDLPYFGRFTTTLDPSAQTITNIVDLGLRLPMTTYDLQGVDMTDQQRTEFVKLAGPKKRDAYDQLMPTLQRLVEKGDREKAQNLLSDAASNIHRAAKQQMIRQMKISN